MLYIFNSAYRPEYASNVLNTLHLPAGTINKYRYSFKGETINLKQKHYNLIKLLTKNDQVLITFIDRFSLGGYFYHPLRKGIFHRYYEEGNYVFIEVKLTDYIYPRNISDFNSTKIVELAEKPVLTNSNPENTNDGSYAVVDSDILNVPDYYSNDEAWINIVNGIKGCRAFKEIETLFTQLQIFDQNNNITSFAKLYKSKNYKLHLIYYYPSQEIDRKKSNNIILSIQTSINPDKPVSHNISCNTVQDNIEINLTPPFDLEKYNITFSLKKTNKEICISNRPLVIPVLNSMCRIIVNISLFLFYAIFLYLGSISLDSIDASSISQFVKSLNLFKILTSFINTIILFGIFRMVGGKKML